MLDFPDLSVKALLELQDDRVDPLLDANPADHGHCVTGGAPGQHSFTRTACPFCSKPLVVAITKPVLTLYPIW